jgi:hypothetical protein
MKYANFIIMILVVEMFAATLINAQEKTTVKDPNEIFNSIMQTMPKDMKARVDSASVVQNSKKTNIVTEHVLSDDRKASFTDNSAIDVSLDKLPDAIRQQVIKTMMELEQDKKERMLEFKESKGFQKK